MPRRTSQKVVNINDRRKPDHPDHIKRTNLAFDLAEINRLSSTETLMLLFVSHCDGLGDGWRTTIEGIIAKTRLSRNTIVKVTGSLVERGLISVEKAHKQTNKYTFIHGLGAKDAVKNDDLASSNLTVEPSELTAEPSKVCAITKKTRKQPTPVGVVGCLLTPGERVLALDHHFRLQAMVVKPSGDVNFGRRAPVRDENDVVVGEGGFADTYTPWIIECPTRQTDLSLAHHPMVKVAEWEKWIKEEGFGDCGACPIDTQRELAAFAVFVWHRMSNKKADLGYFATTFASTKWEHEPQDDLVLREGRLEYRHPMADGSVV